MVDQIDPQDLYEYFALYEQYQQAEEPRLMEELDSRLSQHKDRFHKHSKAVLKCLQEGERDFMAKYEAAYKDLVFDLEMHAKTLEEIEKTHTFDTERDVWVPKGE